jgi:hypothetical protein
MTLTYPIFPTGKSVEFMRSSLDLPTVGHGRVRINEQRFGPPAGGVALDTRGGAVYRQGGERTVLRK